MPRTCCVLGCKSNVGSQRAPVVPTFCFPRDEKRKKLWLQCINREDLIPTKSSAVCIRHFRKNFIIRETSARRKNCSQRGVCRQSPKLTSNAYPSVRLKRLRSQSLRINHCYSECKNTSKEEEEDYMVGAGSAKDTLGDRHRTERRIFREDAEISQDLSEDRADWYGGLRPRILRARRRPSTASTRSSSAPSGPAPAPETPPSPPPPPPPLPAATDGVGDVAMIKEEYISFDEVFANDDNVDSMEILEYTSDETEQKNDDSMDILQNTSDETEQKVIKCEPSTEVEEKPIKGEIEVIQSCCVSGCFSNLRAPLVTMFPFPADESQKKLWLKCIGREEYVPTRFSAVCIHHFREEFILREIKSTRSNGAVVVVPIEKPSLVPDAFPSLFIRRSPKALFSEKTPLTRKRRKKLPEVPGSQSKKLPGSQSKKLPASASKKLPASESKKLPASESKKLPASESMKLPASQSMTLCVTEEYVVKEENIIQDSWIDNVKEEMKIDEEWFSNDSEDNFCLSPMTIKKEYDEEVLIGF